MSVQPGRRYQALQAHLRERVDDREQADGQNGRPARVYPRRLTSSLTYRAPSQPPYTNTAIRKPATALPRPSIPLRLSQPLVMWKVPGGG